MYFDSRRSTVVATHGMVATSQPLAAVAGLRVLMEGGNAVDAAIAGAAVLNVVEPVSTGVGGDMFALVWNNKEKSVAPSTAADGRLPGRLWRPSGNRATKKMPHRGVHSVTVPGAVDGWEKLLESCGTMPMSKLLEPAIQYAEGGLPRIPTSSLSSGRKWCSCCLNCHRARKCCWTDVRRATAR